MLRKNIFSDVIILTNSLISAVKCTLCSIDTGSLAAVQPVEILYDQRQSAPVAPSAPSVPQSPRPDLTALPQEGIHFKNTSKNPCLKSLIRIGPRGLFFWFY